MKKFSAILISVLVLSCSFLISASASDLADGTYEVPVTLIHSEEEKDSFGNKFILPTAILEVENGNKTITLLLTTNMSGIEFSYYKDGSLEGDVLPCEAVSGTVVNSETYELGFIIPVATDGEPGLKFSVPVMPMSPSARLRIDYDNAVLVSGGETQTTAQASTAPTATTQATTEATTASQTQATTTAPPTVQTTQTVTSAAPTTAAAVYEPSVMTTAGYTVTETASEDTKEDESAFGTVGFMLVALAATGALTALLITDSKEKEKNDD